MPQGKRKNSVSLNAYIGRPLLDMLEAVCRETGQSKTVAIERAILAACREPADGQAGTGQPGGEGGE